MPAVRVVCAALQARFAPVPALIPAGLGLEPGLLLCKVQAFSDGSVPAHGLQASLLQLQRPSFDRAQFNLHRLQGALDSSDEFKSPMALS